MLDLVVDLTELSAADLGRGIAAGEIDPVVLAQTYLDKIAAHPLADRIYARVTPERALAEAHAAKERAVSGTRLSALDGVPVSWKDLFDTKDITTEAGTALLKDRVPGEDAEVLKAASSLGLVCLGKTHLSELAFSGLGLNPITASAPCINDDRAVSGGSSSGAAASVAFGLAPIAIGSDTGGSVRIPSAWNDLVGLKTTWGRLPLTGSVPLCSYFDTVGPLCKTVEDAALMLGALEGQDVPFAPGSLVGKRFAVLETMVLDDIRAEPLAAYEAAIAALKVAGAEIVPLEFEAIRANMAETGILYTYDAWANWGDEITKHGEVMFAPIRERFEAGAAFSEADYKAAWSHLEETRTAWAEACEGFDAVLCPTSPILPPDAERLMTDDDYYVTENLLSLRNTRVGNLLGGAVLTLPTGHPSCGLSFMGKVNGEEALLALGAAAEVALKG